VFGLVEDASRPLIDTLADHVRDRRLLVILDNCEHLLDACAALSKRLLQAGASLRILASSRAPLQIAGEAAYHVPTLSVPDLRSETNALSLAQHESARLFIDRAMANQPAFQLSNENAAAVAQICARLDGIPLALELAAARTRALSVEAIAARLDDRFRLLVSGDRTVLPRQRTLRALIDWSHDLLSPPEQVLFRRLAVFAGGWSLEAAEQVGSGNNGVPEIDVMDLLSQLVEKSLVVLDVDNQRYRMLDTVRQYASERLAASADAAAAPEQHLAYHVAFAELARPGLAGPDQGQWLARLDQERENLLVAHAWSEHAAGGTEWALRLMHALRPYWINRGLMTQGHRMAVDLLHRAAIQQRDEARCRALFGAGQFCCFMGNYDEARGHLSEGLAIARETGNTPWIAGALQPLGMACIGLGDLVAARAHLKEAVVMAEAVGNPRELAAAQNNLAQLYRMEGLLDEAQPLYESMIESARQMGDKENIAVGLLNLSMVRITRGLATSAPPLLSEALSLAAEIGSRPCELSTLEVCAGLACALSDWAHGAQFLGMGEALAKETGLQRDPVDDAFLAPLIERAQESLGKPQFRLLADQAAVLPKDASMMQVQGWLQQVDASPA
jgi:predicted ATPase